MNKAKRRFWEYTVTLGMGGGEYWSSTKAEKEHLCEVFAELQLYRNEYLKGESSRPILLTYQKVQRSTIWGIKGQEFATEGIAKLVHLEIAEDGSMKRVKAESK